MSIKTTNSHLTVLACVAAGLNTAEAINSVTGFSNTKIYTIRRQLRDDWDVDIDTIVDESINRRVWTVSDFGYFNESKVRQAAEALNLNQAV